MKKYQNDWCKGKLKIKCEWKEKDTILVNPDGQVWPCCYLGNPNFLYEQLKDEELEVAEEVTLSRQLENIERSVKWHPLNPVLKEYIDNKEEHNIFNKSIDEIVKNDWFTKTLPESWNDSDTIIHQCWRLCNKHSDVDPSDGTRR